MDNMVCARYLISQIIQFKRYLFSKSINIFRHLKLEIALAIPASNVTIPFYAISIKKHYWDKIASTNSLQL